MSIDEALLYLGCRSLRTDAEQQQIEEARLSQELSQKLHRKIHGNSR